MEVTRMKVNRFSSYRGNEAANRRLLSELAAHGVTETHWTEHARQRTQEMVNAGFQFEHIMKAVKTPEQTYWSPTHEQPCGRFGDVSVGLMADKWGRAVVVTVLPASSSAWEKFYAAGEHEGRERRQPKPAQRRTEPKRPELPESLPDDVDDAVALISDAPFKMSFFMYNKDEISRLMESDPEVKRVFLASAERAVNSASHRENRGRMEADIKMHPHLSPKDRQRLLVALHQQGKSITAISGGLPTLGKRH